MLLITGAQGQLARELSLVCRERNLAFCALMHRELDITDPGAVRAAVDAAKPDCIVNCAAMSNVDACEGNAAAAYAVNAYGPWLLARIGIPVVQLSTDYVFDGTSRLPYGTDAPAHPVNVYGLTKRAGETALLEGGFSGLIVRTAWLYGGPGSGTNFYGTIRRLAKEREALSVVTDQIGSPTLAADLARILVRLIELGAHRAPVRVVHAVNAGSCSRYEFAQAVAEDLNLACRIEPTDSDTFERQNPARAARPRFTALDTASLEAFGIRPRHWREALRSLTEKEA